MTVTKPEQRNSLCTTDGGTQIKSCYQVAHGPLSCQKLREANPRFHIER